MKKIVLVILLLLFPSMVLAKDTCNNNDIKIEEITIEEKEGYTEELTPVSIDNNKINLNLEMYNVGESITYKIKVKNNSNNDYYFTKDSFNLNTDYLEYEILNDSEVIKSNEEKEIELKITYKEKIPEDEFNENNMMSITLTDTPLSNPSTKRTISLLLLVTFVTMTIFIIRNKKLNKVLIGIIICSIPLSIKALCIVNLEINANITINEKEAIFLPGPEVNLKMKLLAGDDILTETSTENIIDENITFVKYSNIEPVIENKSEKNIVSTIDSPYPIYMWYEEGTIFWWSETPYLKLNQNSSYMFTQLTNLKNITDFRRFNASNVETMRYMFAGDINISTLNGIEGWDISKVTNISVMFSNVRKVNSLEPIAKWNISKIETLEHTFYNMNSLSSLEGLKKWDTRQVNNLNMTFASIGLENLNGLENWNTANVTDMGGSFLNNNLNDISALTNWNVSNVNNYVMMFADNRDLSNTSVINNWDIQKNANFFNMFWHTPSHPEFTKVTGTWNSTGTFTPTP